MQIAQSRTDYISEKGRFVPERMPLPAMEPRRSVPAAVLDLFRFVCRHAPARCHLLIDAAGRIIDQHVPERGDPLVEGPLRAVRGTLAARREEHRKPLAGLIEHACGMAHEDFTAAELRLAGKASARGQFVRAIPLTLARAGAVRGAQYGCISICDLEEPSAPSAARLRLLLGLSPREAEIVVAIFVGASLIELAERLGITVHTARQHLKTIFKKTATRRQSELIALAAML